MRLEKIEPGKRKGQFFLQFEEEKLCLYKSELKEAGIDLNAAYPAPVSEEVYRHLIEILIRRAKKRALHLLEARGRTVSQLRDKLMEGGFGREASEAAVSYAASFGYINDREYIRSFIIGRAGKKSRKEIVFLLSQKGLDRELIDEVSGEMITEDSERETLRRLLEKKGYDSCAQEPEKQRKIMAYLARKGFSYEAIKRACESFDA